MERNSPHSSSNRHQGVYRGRRPDKQLKWEPGLWSLHSATWDGVEVRPSPAGGNRLWPQDARQRLHQVGQRAQQGQAAR